MQTEKEYCNFPSCYEYKIKDSNFCSDHKKTIWFRQNNISIFMGDKNVGQILREVTGTVGIDFIYTLTLNEIKAIAVAIDDDEDKLLNDKYSGDPNAD